MDSKLLKIILALAVSVLSGCFESDPVYTGVGSQGTQVDAGRDFPRPVTCGNGICDVPDETRQNCCEDCGGGCGDGYCCPESGENGCTCENDCPDLRSVCGDGICCTEPTLQFPEGENVNNCCYDCGGGCGDGFCCGGQAPKGTAEDKCTCNADCGDSVCGDFHCACDETCSGCPIDCGECLSDCCSPVYDAESTGCADPIVEACVCRVDPLCCSERWDLDCVELVEELGCGICTECGDGKCEAPKEDSSNCAEDCGSDCGDGVCNGTEEVCSCPMDCGSSPVCGNGSCDCPGVDGQQETSGSCCEDCGATCGDGVCNCGEDSCGCPEDCAAPVCGDGVCDCSETCSECPQDCEACPTCASPIDVTDFINGSNYFGTWRHAADEHIGSCTEDGIANLGYGFPEIVFRVIPYFSGTLSVSVIHPGTDSATVLYARNICDDKTTELYDVFLAARACNVRFTDRRTVFVLESQITFEIRDSTPVYIFLERRTVDWVGKFEMSLTILPSSQN